MHFGNGSLLLLAPKMFNVHASSAEIHPVVAINLSAVSVPGAHVVLCFPAVADAHCSGVPVAPPIAGVPAVAGWNPSRCWFSY
jgi:hypothetical protein